MADDGVANGVDDRNNEQLETKISALERERDELTSENAERKEQIKKLTVEIEGLRRDGDEMKEKLERKEQIKKLTVEIEGLRRDGAEMKEKLEEMKGEIARSEDSVKATEVIAARATELETEVARLQHDMISEMSGADEARNEVAELKKVLGEKESRVENLEKEVEGLKKVKLESEVRLKELEMKIGTLEMKEVEERNKRIRVEEELRDKIGEKDREIEGVKQKVLESERNSAELMHETSEWVKEKLILEMALKESEEKTKSLESNIVRLREEAEEAEKLIKSLKEKPAVTVTRNVNGIQSEEKKGLKLEWPVLAAAGSTGAVVAAAAAAIYIYSAKQQRR